MPSAVWCEWCPTPTVPVPMARRLVLMPVLPSVTVSEAANFFGSVWSVIACRMDLRTNHAAPAAVTDRTRNWRRCMRPPGRWLVMRLHQGDGTYFDLSASAWRCCRHGWRYFGRGSGGEAKSERAFRQASSGLSLDAERRGKQPERQSDRQVYDFEYAM